MPTIVTYTTERQQAERAAVKDWSIEVGRHGDHDPYVRYTRTGITVQAEFQVPVRFLPLPQRLGGDLIDATRTVYSPLICVDGRCGERVERTDDIRVLLSWLTEVF